MGLGRNANPLTNATETSSRALESGLDVIGMLDDPEDRPSSTATFVAFVGKRPRSV